MSVEVFVDTNVLYYANTDSADPRHRLARERIIVAAAQRAGAPYLWTEDLGAGQRYGQVQAINPLRS